MRILADENVARAIVDRLRSVGHDVVWVRETAKRAEDGEVIRMAQDQCRLLLTFDKGFGERVFMLKQPVPGVVLVRAESPDAKLLATLVESVLAGRDDWLGHFSVIESDRLRMIPIRHFQ
jgi:predicted nuclease of predicted toxin-antitoxin system